MAVENGENYMTTIDVLNMKFTVYQNPLVIKFSFHVSCLSGQVTSFRKYFYYHTHISGNWIEKLKH